jgi:Ca2+-binding EF-hand superfamily protein
LSEVSDVHVEYTQAFILFDRDEDGLITSKDLSLLIRSLEQNPTDNQIQQLVDNIIDAGS